MAEITGLHHLSLSVRDVESSTAWYSRVLGLEKAFEHADRDQGWVKVQLVHPTNGLRLSFTAHEGNLGESFSELHTGMDHVAFRVSDRAALEEWLARLDALGVTHSPIKQTVTGHVITFRDPDNIQLEVFAPREQA
jgi:glyoxylase I family protein